MMVSNAVGLKGPYYALGWEGCVSITTCPRSNHRRNGELMCDPLENIGCLLGSKTLMVVIFVLLG